MIYYLTLLRSRWNPKTSSRPFHFQLVFQRLSPLVPDQPQLATVSVVEVIVSAWSCGVKLPTTVTSLIIVRIVIIVCIELLKSENISLNTPGKDKRGRRETIQSQRHHWKLTHRIPRLSSTSTSFFLYDRNPIKRMKVESIQNITKRQTQLCNAIDSEV